MILNSNSNTFQDSLQTINKSNADKALADLPVKSPGRPKKDAAIETFLSHNPANPIWLSISETAKICGVNPKTFRRALQSKKIAYGVVKNRYVIDLRSALIYMNSNKKLKNKLLIYGLGQFVQSWRK